MATPYPTLFSPLRIGAGTMRNRVLHAPMSVCYADADGRATRAMAEHYGRRAMGGTGMEITENVAVSLAGRQMPKQPMLADEAAVPGFRAVADEIRRHGALAVMQIVHAGRYAGPWDAYEAARRLAPSAVPFPLLPGRTVVPAEITPAEIEASIAEFAATARLAEAAGFDGVEVHGAQGFLVSSFLSPRMNVRTDAWGGAYENRTRYAKEVVRAVRGAVSPDLIVGFHLMSDELAPGGWTVEESCRLVPELADLGIDFVMPVVSTFETLKSPENAGLMGRPLFQHAEVKAIAAACPVPVFTNGGIAEPDLAERVLSQGEASAVGLGRPLFADPDWASKAMAGAASDIRRCDCSEATCLRTQLTGGQCASWPESAKALGYFGYAA